MTDISMCRNAECPSRTSCYRYRARPNPYRQAYADFKVPDGESKCDYYSYTQPDSPWLESMGNCDGSS